MEEDIYLDKLDRRGIKPTAIRLLVIKAMMQAERAVSLLDWKHCSDTVDKSTISRTIALFLSHHLIHSIDDGSGSLKYAVCAQLLQLCGTGFTFAFFIVRNVIVHSAWKVHISR